MTPEQRRHFETVFLPGLRRCQERREQAAQEVLITLQQRRGVSSSLVPTQLNQDIITELDDYIAAEIKGARRRRPMPTSAQVFTFSKRAK